MAKSQTPPKARLTNVMAQRKTTTTCSEAGFQYSGKHHTGPRPGMDHLDAIRRIELVDVQPRCNQLLRLLAIHGQDSKQKDDALGQAHHLLTVDESEGTSSRGRDIVWGEAHLV